MTTNLAYPLKSHQSIFALLLTIVCTFQGCNNQNADKPDQVTKQGQVTEQQEGKASWYGPGFDGQKTANGEIYDPDGLTAAHPSLPLGSKVEVTNLENNRKVDVKITDRGPYVKGRIIDLSKAAAKKLAMTKHGVSKVKIKMHKPHKKQKHYRKFSAKTQPHHK